VSEDEEDEEEEEATESGSEEKAASSSSSELSLGESDLDLSLSDKEGTSLLWPLPFHRIDIMSIVVQDEKLRPRDESKGARAGAMAKYNAARDSEQLFWTRLIC
jgi:hypothetical protein